MSYDSSPQVVDYSLRTDEVIGCVYEAAKKVQGCRRCLIALAIFHRSQRDDLNATRLGIFSPVWDLSQMISLTGSRSGLSGPGKSSAVGALRPLSSCIWMARCSVRHSLEFTQGEVVQHSFPIQVGQVSLVCISGGDTTTDTCFLPPA